LKTQRDETLYDFFQRELKELEYLENQDKIDLFYSDEVGFQLNPNPVYAWLEKGSQASLPAQKGTLLNILGFINRANEAAFYEYESSMDSRMFAYLVDDFIKLRKKEKPLVLIVDNATFRTSNYIKEKCKEWKVKEVYLQFIPAYCPELNKIEILWSRSNITGSV